MKLELLLAIIGTYAAVMGILMYLFFSKRAHKLYSRIRIKLFGIKQTTFDEVIASVESHSLDFNKKYIELDAEIERRGSYDSIMLSTHRSNDKVWWYVRTHEKKGHDEKYGYKVGETYKLRLYIREIEYASYENDGNGRYYIWSSIA